MDKRKNKKEKNEKYIGMCGNTENDQSLFFSSVWIIILTLLSLSIVAKNYFITQLADFK